MIKFLSTTIGTLVAVVGFLYYLMLNTNFVPTDLSGGYLSINIIVFLLLIFVGVMCLSVLLAFVGKRVFTKEEDLVVSIKFAIRYGILFSLGLLLVYLLHFFHILNFVWGLAILLVVILSLFVI